MTPLNYGNVFSLTLQLISGSVLLHTFSEVLEMCLYQGVSIPYCFTSCWLAELDIKQQRGKITGNSNSRAAEFCLVPLSTCERKAPCTVFWLALYDIISHCFWVQQVDVLVKEGLCPNSAALSTVYSSWTLHMQLRVLMGCSESSCLHSEILI